MAHSFRSASDARRAAEAATRGCDPRGDRYRRLVQVSKLLSYNLRHNSSNPLGEDGFMSLGDLLKLCPVTTDEVCDVVEDWSRNEKGNLRFEMTEREDGSFWIRATCHHSIDKVDKRRIHAKPQGITLSRYESHKSACRKLRTLGSVSNRSPPLEIIPCAICLAETRTHAVIPCGHKCLCSHCATVLQGGPLRCPLCQSRFDSIVQIFD